MIVTNFLSTGIATLISSSLDEIITFGSFIGKVYYDSNNLIIHQIRRQYGDNNIDPIQTDIGSTSAPEEIDTIDNFTDRVDALLIHQLRRQYGEG